VTDREDRLSFLMEVAHHRLHPLIGANVSRPPPAGAIDRMIVLEPHLGEGLVQNEVVAGLFGIGLATLEIVEDVAMTSPAFLSGHTT
jgi:hypothetical protein